MRQNWKEGILPPSVHKLNLLSVYERPKTINCPRSFLGGMRFKECCVRGIDEVSQLVDEACPNTREGRDKNSWKIRR